MDYYEKNYIEDYNYYSKYLKIAKTRNKLKQSIFFNEILKHFQKNVFKNDEDKALEEAEKNFNNIKIIFTDDGITKADEKILDICIIPFQKKEGNLENELKTLSELFKYKGKTDHIYKGILLILLQLKFF